MKDLVGLEAHFFRSPGQKAPVWAALSVVGLVDCATVTTNRTLSVFYVNSLKTETVPLGNMPPLYCMQHAYPSLDLKTVLSVNGGKGTRGRVIIFT